MLLRLAHRFLFEPDVRLLLRFARVAGWRNMLAINRFKRDLRAGRAPFPPFLFLSITTQCHLHCRGCWVTPIRPPQHLPADTLENVIRSCEAEGCRFFGLLGGEPLLYPHLLELLERHPDCYFQIFTNGARLTADVACELRRLGNVTPLISIEGRARVSDERRGGRNVFGQALAALEACHDAGLIAGVATSVCQANFAEVVAPEFVTEMIDRGALYLWYYIYRPVGQDPAPELALTAEQIQALRRFLVDIRGRAPIVIVDAYWDHLGRALCPAAVGISHHVSPWGDVEPCPPVQFAMDNIGDGRDLANRLRRSVFLPRFREFARKATRGCVLLDCPQRLNGFLRECQARDSSGRSSAYAELAAMQKRPGHHQPGQEIPEKQWFYRFAKRHWFFGFGAYG
jgi:MoaA/NifB/PqqE/SkfB family radical SAM enzyme